MASFGGKRELYGRYIRKITAVLAVVIFLALTAALTARAEGEDVPTQSTEPDATSLSVTIRESRGNNASRLRDGKYSTRNAYKAGDTITVACEQEMAGVYIRWGSEVKPYRLLYGGREETHGENGFLHDYVKLEERAKEVVIQLDSDLQICEISAREAYPVLLRQIYRPLDPAAMARTLALIDKLQKNVRFYRLGCNMEPDAAQVAYEGMKGTV